MYPDQIKNYTSEEQFKKHKKLLQDLTKYYTARMAESSPALYNIQKEKWLLDRHFRIWKKKHQK